ncbi:mechanosensitive ion channel family protein [Peptoniphilus sp. GNH]|nr:mechanosensitive ion channel family protein [Peptoniphilus sp. GNH]
MMREVRKIKIKEVIELRKLINKNGIWGKILVVILVLLFAKLLVHLIKRAFKLWKSKDRIKNLPSFPRIDTLTGGLEKGLAFFVYFIGAMFILNIFGYNTRNLFATLGIGSLLIGMGAQSFIKDLIGGLLLITEDVISVGDYIVLNEFEGYVTEIGIRLTKIKNNSGEIYIVPNGQIQGLINKSRSLQRTLIVLRISADEDPKKVIDILKESLKPFKDRKDIKSGPDVWGVTGNFALSYEISLAFFTDWGKNWDLDYEIRQKCIEVLQKNGIKTLNRKNLEEEDALIQIK